MKPEAAEILNDALALPLRERVALVRSLIASLAPYAGADAAEVLAYSNVGRFEQARDRALARLQRGIDLEWTPARSRDDLHCR